MVAKSHRPWLHVCTSVLGLLAGFGLLSGSAHAQQAATSAASDESGTLTEVVVTAERRTQNLQTVPFAATALSGADLQKKGIVTIDDLQFTTPSLTINNAGQQALINIRGIGKADTSIQSSVGAVVYRDGFVVFQGTFNDEPYYDIASIEVLRGPQGTLAGQNASGGAVFITEVNPSLAAGYHGYAQAQYGNYNDAQLQGAVNLPMSDTLAVRIAVNDEYHDSFYKVTGSGNFSGHPGLMKASSTRLSLLWQPTDNLSAVWKTDYNYVDLGGIISAPVLTTPDPFHVTNNARNLYLDKFVRTDLTLNYQMPNGLTLRSISGYEKGRSRQFADLDGSSKLNFTTADIINDTVYSQEVNLLSRDTGAFRWLVGAYDWHDTASLPADGGFVVTTTTQTRLTYNAPKHSDAVFGQMTYDVTPTLQLLLGARYTESTYSVNSDKLTLTLAGVPTANVVGIGHRSESKPTGKFAVNLKITPDEFAYAFVATGHKAGGENTYPNGAPGTTGVQSFNGEDVTEFETGLKSTLFGGHLRTQIDAYDNVFTGFQVPIFDPNLHQTQIVNVNSQTVIYGLEGQVQAVFGDLSFDLGGAYLHSKLGQFSAINPNNPQAGLINLSGIEQVNAPHYTFNAGAQYTMHLDNGATLTPELNYGFVGQQLSAVFPSLPALTHLKARNIVNAQLTYAVNTWRITAYSTNLGDDRYYAAIAGTTGIAGPPRQYGLRLAVDF